MINKLKLAELINKKIVIFGTGKFGEKWFEILKSYEIDVECFSDNDEKKWNKNFIGKKVISLDELYNFEKSETLIVIASFAAIDIFYQLLLVGFREVYIGEFAQDYTRNDLSIGGLITYSLDESKSDPGTEQLRYIIEKLEFNINKNIFINYNNIPKLCEILEDDESRVTISNILKYKMTRENKLLSDIYIPTQYFLSDIFKMSDAEVFIDGGAYVGDTIKDFLKFTNNKFKAIYSFEPNKYIYNGIKQLYKKNENIHIINKGISNNEISTNFNINGAGSQIDENGSDQIKTVSLDKFIKEKVTFIKLDIEGYEMEALEGSKKIILRDKPKLAICIYHKEDDIWKIPLYIKSLVPEYKIYIRHHSNSNLWETVCYATI
jgi:FkbM family methyltransferase